MWNVAGSFSITHQQNSITKTVFSYSFDISQKMCSFSSVWWINIIIFLHSRNQGRGVHALLVLLPLSSRKAELTTTTPYWWHYETFKVAKIIPKTDFCKHLKNLEVQHLIHFDYYYLFVATLTYPISQCRYLATSDGHYSMIQFCPATSFFPFENGVPKCHKKHRKFICEHFAKVSNKIYCFIFFRTLSLTYILITRIIYALVKSYDVTNVKKYINNA